MRRCYFICILFTFCFYLSGQKIEYKFTKLSVDEGLSNNQVNAIIEDTLGFIWFGTSDGLNKYDGVNLKIYKSDESNPNSLQNSNIRSLFRDQSGGIWIGYNEYGFSKYNIIADNFINYTFANSDVSLQPMGVYCFYEYSDSLLFLGAESGLHIFNKKKNELVNFFAENKLDAEQQLNVNHIFQDNSRNLWLSTDKDIIRIPPSNDTTFQYDTILKISENNHWVQQILTTSNDHMYILKNNSLLLANSDLTKINSTVEFGGFASQMAMDKHEHIWIATDGLYHFEGTEYHAWKHNPLNPYSLSNNALKSIYISSDGIVWVGTWHKGLNYFKPDDRANYFHHFFRSDQESEITENVIEYIFVDKEGLIWISTNWGGISIYDPKTATFKYLNMDMTPGKALASNLNQVIYEDDYIWIGSFRRGLDRYDKRTGTIVNYSIKKVQGQMPKINDIITQLDNPQYLLLATEAGLMRFNKKTHQSFYYAPGDYKYPVNAVRNVIPYRDNKYFIAMPKNGLYIFDSEKQSFSPFIQDKFNSTYLNNIVYDSLENLLYIAASNGLNVYDFERSNLTVFNKKSGLPNDNIVSIIKDHHGALWLGTLNGLSRAVIIKTEYLEILEIDNFSVNDGLQGKIFRDNAVSKTAGNYLLFGGANGFNMFHPDSILTERPVPKIYIRDFSVFNQSISEKMPSNNEAAYSNVNLLKHINLAHNQNSITVELASIDFLSADKNQYRYRLEGLDKTWNYIQHRKFATYTNLEPGNYTFIAEVSSNDDWGKSSVKLDIKIIPPFWKTDWFKVLIVLLIALLLFSIYYLRISFYKKQQQILEDRVKRRTESLHEANEELKTKNEQIQSMSTQVREANEMKFRFFTNIHHEFRTSLSLILGPIEEINKGHSTKQNISVLSKHARRLNNLVNQVLDFRKIDLGKVQLRLINADIIAYLSEIKAHFDAKAEQMNVSYNIYTEEQYIRTWFDAEHLEKTIFNLLSNAFKYTPKDGAVSLYIRKRKLVCPLDSLSINTACFFEVADFSKHADDFIELEITDNGKGFASEVHIQKLFERFYQASPSFTSHQSGTGIGLALCKELIESHQGFIRAMNNKHGGATLKIFIPYGESWFKNMANVQLLKDAPASKKVFTDIENYIENDDLNISDEDRKDESENRRRLLVIEDNLDIHFFLKNNLNEYDLMFAENGKSGIEFAEKFIPDIIVCDIMLPDMDGFEILQELKNDIKTSHIPIILLTALTGEENLIKGLKVGADDYITKPFSMQHLKTRIDNLLYIRRKLHEVYKVKKDFVPEEISTNPTEQKLLVQIKEIIQENIKDESFNVEKLASEVGLSRNHLYRKLSSLIGDNPAKLIRDSRLDYAKKLLRKNEYTVNEISLMAGFSEASNFIRIFSKEYGITPKKYALGEEIDN